MIWKPLLALSCILAAGIWLAGCAASPEQVFRRATGAFAEGDVAYGMRHFSRRLAERSSQADLELYYSNPDNRRGVEFLMEELKFQVLEQDDDHAVARVVWRTGRTEQVYFVREDGAWKIDREPAPSS